MKWISMSIGDANKAFENIENGVLMSQDLNDDYQTLRTAMISKYNEILNETELTDEGLVKNKYAFDVEIGALLYEVLEDFQITMYEINDIGVWRYLSLVVVPEITLIRFGVHADRFYTNPRRLYLRTHWWYIYLSFQETMEETKNYLKGNTTDTVVQLVERAGRDGYNLELYREIIKRYPEYRSLTIEGLFRKVMKLNTSKILVVEPALYKGGVEAYVKDLYEYFDE